MIETLHAILVNAEVRNEEAVEEHLQRHFVVDSFWYN